MAEGGMYVSAGGWLFIRQLFAFAGFDLMDGFGGGEVFGHCSAEFGDGLAEFGAHLVVGLVGLPLAGDVLALELFFGLGGAEEVGGELSVAHMVEDFLVPFQTLAVVNFLSQLEVVLEHLFAQEEALFLLGGQGLIGLHLLDFGDAGLDGEVGLAEGYDFLRWVGILYDEITGVAGEFDGIYCLGMSDACLYYFGDVTEIGQNVLRAVFTSLPGLFNHIHKVAVIGIFERFGKGA